jgi:hypothetical protein
MMMDASNISCQPRYRLHCTQAGGICCIKCLLRRRSSLVLGQQIYNTIVLSSLCNMLFVATYWPKTALHA